MGLPYNGVGKIVLSPIATHTLLPTIHTLQLSFGQRSESEDENLDAK